MQKEELINNHQYHIVPSSLEEIDVLCKRLKEKGYVIHHNLDHVLEFKRLPVGLCIDNGITNHNGGKCIFTSNVTCMACYVSCYKRRPLKVKEVLDNFDKLIDELDIVFYNELLLNDPTGKK